MAFGEVLRSNAEVSAAVGVTEYPTLLVVCGGNKDVVVKYEGGCRLQYHWSAVPSLFAAQQS